MPRRIVILFVAVLLVSMAVVQMRHESRHRFSELQAQQAERDALNVEWGKLLLEEGAWSQHRRIEVMARTRLGMSSPDSARIRVVRVKPDSAL
ncbi:MAG: cell division protein FtsL [Gammaproteobacteria bacterium]|nr:cell division protein FtsL [Gammaproteobacteria bacterium]